MKGWYEDTILPTYPVQYWLSRHLRQSIDWGWVAIASVRSHKPCTILYLASFLFVLLRHYISLCDCLSVCLVSGGVLRYISGSHAVLFLILCRILCLYVSYCPVLCLSLCVSRCPVSMSGCPSIWLSVCWGVSVCTCPVYMPGRTKVRLSVRGVSVCLCPVSILICLWYFDYKSYSQNKILFT